MNRLPLFAAAFGLALLAVPLAQAFTIEDQSSTASNNAARLADPASRLTGNGNGNGGTTIQQGNTTLQFGSGRPSSFDSRYNIERMFNPNGRPGDDR